MLRYKPSKHHPVRVRLPKSIDIRTTMLYNGRVKQKKVTSNQHLTNVS